MYVKCASCQHVFEATQYGQVRCPSCGAELMIQEPGAAPSLSAPPHAGAPGPGDAFALPQDWSTPWEERSSRGFFAGLFETAKMSLLHPVQFFQRMRVDNANGALSYPWILQGVALLFTAGYEALLPFMRTDVTEFESNPVLAPYSGLMTQLYTPLAPGWFGMRLGMLALYPISLLITVGIFHLCTLIVGGGKGGFTATFRAFGYAVAPLLLAVVPLVGPFAGAVWMLALIGVGLHFTHRMSVGRTVAAMLIPTGLLCLCAACFGGLAAVAAMGALGK